MSGRGASVKLQGLVQFLAQRYRSTSTTPGNGPLLYRGPLLGDDDVVAAKLGGVRSVHQGLQIVTTKTNIVKVVDGKVETQIITTRSGFNFPQWAKWLLGSVMSFLLPFLKPKWMQLQKIEGEAEHVIEEVETVAQVVEKVATVAEKISEDLAEKLPDNGKLKEAALLVERVSKVTAQDAHLTMDIIHKVDGVKQDLETLVEPLVDKILDQTKSGRK